MHQMQNTHKKHIANSNHGQQKYLHQSSTETITEFKPPHP